MVSRLTSVPVLDVTKDNIATLYPLISLAIRGADFVAIDCVSEFDCKINQCLCY